MYIEGALCSRHSIEGIILYSAGEAKQMYIYTYYIYYNIHILGRGPSVAEQVKQNVYIYIYYIYMQGAACPWHPIQGILP